MQKKIVDQEVIQSESVSEEMCLEDQDKRLRGANIDEIHD